MGLRAVILLAAMAGGAWVAGCGGSSGSSATPNAVPVLTFLAPSNLTAGGPAFTLTVNGAGFVSGASVQWNGSSRTTTFVSTTQVTAAITAADIATAGKASVTVFNPAPGGGNSNTIVFFILAAGNPVPTLTQLSPSSMKFGNPGFTLSVTGTNFLNNSVVQWNAASRTTTFVSATQLTAAILASDIAAVGTANVTVFNPTPGGGSSNTLTFTITATIPPTGAPRPASVKNPEAGDARAMTPDGRFIAFHATIGGPKPGSEESDQIFLRDTCNHAPSGCTPTTMLISAAADGTPGNGDSLGIPAVSANGRFVAFASLASNLALEDALPEGTSEVFVRDTCIGAKDCTPATFRISVAAFAAPADGGSQRPAIGADGRIVAFESLATNLVSGVTLPAGVSQVYLRDTCIGAQACMPATHVVSVAEDGSPGNASSDHPTITADGRFVLFESAATNLGTNARIKERLFLHDTCFGAPTCGASLGPASAPRDR